jgi:hypothetical protein
MEARCGHGSLPPETPEIDAKRPAQFLCGAQVLSESPFKK